MKTKVKNFLKKNWLSAALAFVVVILLFLYIGKIKSSNVAEKKLAVAEHNINALNDTIRLTKTKDSKPEFDKLAFLTDKVENLAKLNSDLAKEVHNTKGKVSTIISGGVQVVHDTTYLEGTTSTQGSVVAVDFKLDTNYSKGNSRNLAGYTLYDTSNKFSRAVITKDSMNISFVTGIKNLDKGKPEIFLRSDYPGFSATNLDGAVLDPKLFQPKTKQKLITTGINIGYTPLTYSVSKKKLDFDVTRFGASIGINVNLSRLLGKK